MTLERHGWIPTPERWNQKNAGALEPENYNPILLDVPSLFEFVI